MKYIFLALILLLTPISADAVWFDSNWDYKVKLEVVPSKVGGTTTVSSFPVFVDLANLPAGFHTNVKADGCDIRVLESNEATETAFELVSYATSTDTGELHFMADTLSTTSSSTFYIYYGNPSASCYTATSTYGTQNVWTGYNFVYHMNENPGGTAPQMINSTSSTGYLTSSGSMNSADLVAAKVGNGIDYDGTDDVTIRTSAPTPGGGTTQTISFWVKPDSVSSRKGLVGNTDGNSNTSSNFHIENTGANNGTLQYFGFSGSGQIGNVVTGSGALVAGTFTNHHFRRNGAAAAIFKNGASLATATWATSVQNSNHFFGIGAYGTLTSFGLAFDGIIDEWRYTTAVLSDSWILTEYNNQSSPSTFYYIGPEETEGGGGGASTDSGIIWFD